MLSSSTLQFLRDLKSNNNREWFHDHKKTYNTAKEDFANFLQSLINEIQKFDSELGDLSPKQCVFRINRDIRFSKDKSPYKTNFGASIAPGGKKAMTAGYYLHIEPDNHFAGGGMWHPSSPHLKKIRQEIDYHTEDFSKIVTEPKFVRFFGGLQGAQLKTAPKGYPKDHPAIKYLRFKDFVAVRKIDNQQVTAPDLVKVIAETMLTMKPLNDYLKQAIS
ncbi:MAG: DUF2461 domain-containing protein [Chitinophagales bacterium]